MAIKKVSKYRWDIAQNSEKGYWEQFNDKSKGYYYYNFGVEVDFLKYSISSSSNPSSSMVFPDL